MTDDDHGQAAQQGQVGEPDGVGARRRSGGGFGTRRVLVATAALIVVGGSIGAVAAFSGSNGVRRDASPASTSAPDTGSPQPVHHVSSALQQSALALPTAGTLVARMKGTFPGYSRPGGRVDATVPATWHGLPSALPVVARAPGGWLRVRLAQRPDQSTAWIRSSDARLSTTPYRIVVNVTTAHLQLYKSNRLVGDFPVGVGTSYTPTPTGQYFVAFIEPPLSPAYGAFIMITSAHSRAIASWDGTGDAIIGIHGPIGADAEIGTTGAHISNGCVRMHNADLLTLAQVPPGSPIEIVT